MATMNWATVYRSFDHNHLPVVIGDMTTLMTFTQQRKDDIYSANRKIDVQVFASPLIPPWESSHFSGMVICHVIDEIVVMIMLFL